MEVYKIILPQGQIFHADSPYDKSTDHETKNFLPYAENTIISTASFLALLIVNIMDKTLIAALMVPL